MKNLIACLILSFFVMAACENQFVTPENELTEEEKGFKILINKSATGSAKPIYIIDGETYQKQFEVISPDHINSIQVQKGEKVVREFGEDGKNGAVKIEVNKAKTESGEKFKNLPGHSPDVWKDKVVGKFKIQPQGEPVYYIDGIKIPRTKVIELEPDEIDYMRVRFERSEKPAFTHKVEIQLKNK